MVDISAIAGVASSLKIAGDMAKAMIGLRDATMIQGKVIELQGVILSAQSDALAAQSDHFSLLERIRDLEAKMAELEAWNAEKQRYQLTDFGGSTFAYALKPEAGNGEPPHRLCAACYQRGLKSILQSHGHFSGKERTTCPECKTDFWLGEARPQPIGYRPSSDGW